MKLGDIVVLSIMVCLVGLAFSAFFSVNEAWDRHDQKCVALGYDYGFEGRECCKEIMVPSQVVEGAFIAETVCEQVK